MEKRFEKTYLQEDSSRETIEIWVDLQTGINYLFRREAMAGGLTPLLDKNGKPIVSNTR